MNFAAQTPLVAVNVALVDEAGTIACAVPDPIAGETFWSDGGRIAPARGHFAAGIPLCQAAGCVVTDLAGDPVHTGPGLVVAADEPTHRRLLDLVGPHLGERVTS